MTVLMVLTAGREGGTKRPEKCFKWRCGTVIGCDGTSVCVFDLLYLRGPNVGKESITCEDTHHGVCNVESNRSYSASVGGEMLQTFVDYFFINMPFFFFTLLRTAPSILHVCFFKYYQSTFLTSSQICYLKINILVLRLGTSFYCFASQ